MPRFVGSVEQLRSGRKPAAQAAAAIWYVLQQTPRALAALPEHVGHRVEGRRLAVDEARATDGTMGKKIAAARTMRQLDALAGTEQVHGVVAHDIATSHPEDGELVGTQSP
jgi:hypothetical protein